MSLVNEALQIVGRQMDTARGDGVDAFAFVHDHRRRPERRRWGLAALVGGGVAVIAVSAVFSPQLLRAASARGLALADAPPAAWSESPMTMDRKGVRFDVQPPEFTRVSLRVRQVPQAPEPRAHQPQGLVERQETRVGPEALTPTAAAAPAPAATPTPPSPAPNASPAPASPAIVEGREYVQSVDLAGAPLKLTAIAASRQTQVAILNGVSVQPGDRLGDVEVLAIERQRVTLRHAAVTFYLRMP